MKAIMVKYLGWTQTKPSRVKVWAMDNKPVIRSVSSIGEIEGVSINQQVAEQYAKDKGWLKENHKIVGGQINETTEAFCITDK